MHDGESSQEIKTMTDWKCLDWQNMPEISGVYGFQAEDKWLYVGKAKNLRKRLSKHHPALKVALSLELKIRYWYQVSSDYHRLERALIQELQPAWNGATSHNELQERLLYAAYGPVCNLRQPAQEGFVHALADLAQQHPERLICFSEAEQRCILEAKLLFYRESFVTVEMRKAAIELL